MKPTHSIGKTEKFKNLTLEQGRAVISGAKALKVRAPAGSGKTHFQMAYAAARPQKRGLYLAFGKPIQMEADSKLKALGVNTHAKTSHSLAWQFGSILEAAGKLRQPSMRAATTARALNVNYPIASAINATLNNFLCSAEDMICEAHLPSEKESPIAARNQGMVIEGARQLWARMVNPRDTEVQATHDVYLKQWAMTKPKLDFDFILFDECQDANPLLAHLVNAQKHCTRVYVGDPHQAIYAFRGAVNLMDDLEADETTAFTASFRFPPNIGLMASTYLKHWKNNDIPVLGKGKVEKRLATDQNAFLSRTVAGLIAKGFDLHSKGHRMHWIKGFDNYRVKPILEAYSLFKKDGGPITDPVLRLMSSWEEFGDYVEATKDGEAGPVYRLVQQYKDEIPAIIEALRANQVKDEKDAKIVLATAHGSKGLEWPIVRLVDDFFSFKNDKGAWLTPEKIDPQEANLMYVALTRAMKAVAPTKEVAEWFQQRAETKHLFDAPAKPAANPAQYAEQSDEPAQLPRAA